MNEHPPVGRGRTLTRWPLLNYGENWLIWPTRRGGGRGEGRTGFVLDKYTSSLRPIKTHIIKVYIYIYIWISGAIWRKVGRQVTKKGNDLASGATSRACRGRLAWEMSGRAGKKKHLSTLFLQDSTWKRRPCVNLKASVLQAPMGLCAHLPMQRGTPFVCSCWNIFPGNDALASHNRQVEENDVFSELCSQPWLKYHHNTIHSADQRVETAYMLPKWMHTCLEMVSISIMKGEDLIGHSGIHKTKKKRKKSWLIFCPLPD